MKSIATDHAVAIDRIEKQFGEGHAAVRALRGVSFEVRPGEMAVVLGPSGSGKTTLLNVIGALEQPTAGRVLVDGVDVTSLGDEERTRFRRDNVGFVFQFYNLVPTLTALENVMLVGELVGKTEDDAVRALETVEMGDRLHHFPGAMSGGEQQRVAIARAMVKDPGLLLCDEPTGALDLETGRIVLRTLRRLNRESRTTMLLVTHNVAIGEMADRVLKMRSGSIESDRVVDAPVTPEEVEW